MRKRFIIFVSIICTGCIYPYDMSLPAQEWALVVDGDILIGEETTIRLGRLNPLDGKGDVDTPIWAVCWIEDSEGSVYRPVDFHKSDSIVIDMTDAVLNREYRLHIADSFTECTYVSSWRKAQPSPILDSISFTLDPTKKEVSVQLSVTRMAEASPYVQVDYREQWQFHSLFVPQVHYIPGKGYYSGGPNYPYWCWNTAKSHQSKLIRPQGENNDQIVNHTIVTHDIGSQYLQRQYAIDVSVRSLSREAYLYQYESIQSSNSTGDLFSPTPSRTKGNLICENDPKQIVIGYVDVVQVVRGRGFLLDKSCYEDIPATPGRYTNVLDTLCFLPSWEISNVEQPYKGGNTSWSRWDFQYQVLGMIPYEYGSTIVESGAALRTLWGMLWIPKYCADCTLAGGSSVRPADWPE